LLVGGESERVNLVEALNKLHKLIAAGNPDFFDEQFQNFTIADARELKSKNETRPINKSGKKIFILKMDSIMVEAQNALLKLLEEPAEYAHFFLIIPSAHLLLPTVKSRMNVLYAGNRGSKDSEFVQNSDPAAIDASVFLKSSQAKRLELVKKLVDEISKEKRTKQDAIEFLNHLESTIYRQGDLRKNLKALESIDKAKSYLNDRSPSIKMLLEYVALCL
jgi:DNA polymerase III delta prime subunit